MKGDKKCTVCKEWDYLEPDYPKKKEEAMRKAIARCPALTYLWTTLYNLVFPFNTPQKYIKIDDEERQPSGQYCSFPHRPRSHRMLKMLILLYILLSLLLILLSLLYLAYVICSDEFLSGVLGLRTRPMIYVRKGGEDGVVRAMMK